MNGFPGSVAPPGQLHVRALYDYVADDQTSLSFRQGDTIQVITQLESGWWDGVIHGVRGWFPSNYCVVVSEPYEDGGSRTASDSEAEESEEEYSEHEQEHARSGTATGQRNQADTDSQEEAAFWIPQATPDGKIFYFNTLTGLSRMELPLEAPTSANESGPRDRTNIFIPSQTRPPVEMMNAGYGRDDETEYTSESDADDISRPRDSKLSNGQDARSRLSNGTNVSFSALHQGIPPIGTTMTSFANAEAALSTSSLLPRRFFDDAHAVPLTWNSLLEDMRRSIQRYREAVSNGQRSEFVSRVGDISDHLRLLLAAASGTTDNHSGSPSIISTNKALYPQFREMMSRFSKLVLSSHIASADFSPPDAFPKCSREAEAVLQGVLAFVDVARQQKGEEIPRITPGFVTGSKVAGNWRNNGVDTKDPLAVLTPMEDEQSLAPEPTTLLNESLLHRLDDLKRMISSNIRALDEHLTIREKLITPRLQRRISDKVCRAGIRVVEACNPFLSKVESINLATFVSAFRTPQLNDFSEQKQRLYDSVSDLIVACQDIASPLADEWTEVRGPTLHERLSRVRTIGRDLDTSASQVYISLVLLCGLLTPEGRQSPAERPHRLTDGGASYAQHSRAGSREIRPPMLADMAQFKSHSDASKPSIDTQRDSGSSKIERHFGIVPGLNGDDDTPPYLRLDYEGEIALDTKTDPPILRGGTLTALVEQLTRHDKLDASFNSTFLLTYRSFTTAPELFELLVQRWRIQPPFGLGAEEMRTWTTRKQKPIRFRVVNILKSWFDTYWVEPMDEVNQLLMQRALSFAKDTVQSTNTPGAGPLLTAIEQRIRGQDASSKRLIPTSSASAPTSIVPKNLKKIKFLDIDALEFARQLTIIEARLYGRIRPTECLNKTWQKKLVKGEPDPAENVKALILHSNQLTNWVAQMILTQQDVKRRVVVIKHFVSIADKCRLLNNFSCLTSIISALGSAPIHRLSRTWNQVNARTTQALESMRKLMGSTKNFMEYRDALHKANPPCIPFFGIYLTDLTFIEDGIPSVIKKTQLINFAKRAKTAEVIRDIQQYQNVPYGLHPVGELHDYILKNMQSAGDVHEMYERSLQVEPREREDERVARLLSESGFL